MYSFMHFLHAYPVLHTEAGNQPILSFRYRLYFADCAMIVVGVQVSDHISTPGNVLLLSGGVIKDSNIPKLCGHFTLAVTFKNKYSITSFDKMALNIGLYVYVHTH